MKLLLLISYDITDDKGRTKMAKQLEQLGFERLQFSVFGGNCTSAQWSRWNRVLLHIFEKYKSEGDKLYIFPQSEKLFRQTEMNGQAFDIDWITGRTEVLFI
jgi:CRISPR-associated endonuclease Cas2